MQKRYAVSDIHGNAYAFLKLLDHVDPNPEELVVLGDLCDRGFQTWEVYEECDQLIEEGADILMGNHDQWLAQYLVKKIPQHQFFHESIGGEVTVKSLELAKEKGKPVEDTISRVIGNMKTYVEDDDYIFVHAGIDPRIPYMTEQKIETLLMGSKDWSNPNLPHTFDQTIIFGHTPTFRIHRDITEEEATVWSSKKQRKMAIDTGAGFGCRLTMIDLQEGIAYAYDFSTGKIIEYRFKRKERFY